MLRKPFLLLGILLFPLFAFASSVHVGDYFLKGAENVPDDVYAVGGTATFAGKVTGDAFAVGKTIFSQSEISEDVFFVGGEVRLVGAVGDDARLLGGVLMIDGVVQDDVVAIGSKVVIGSTAEIKGSLYVIGGDVEIRGKVLGDVQVYSGQFLLAGAIEGNLELWGKSAFEEPARIGGDFIHHARGKTAAPLSVAIAGKVILDEAQGSGIEFPGDTFIGGFFSLKILMMLALGFLLFFLIRERTEEVLLETLPHFWMRVLRGFLIIILFPLAIPLLLLSVVGIPIALVLGALFLLLLLLSWGYAGILLGAWSEQFFFKRSAFPLSYRPVLLGIMFLSIISVVPFIGAIIHGILLLSVAGSIGTLFFRRVRART